MTWPGSASTSDIKENPTMTDPPPPPRPYLDKVFPEVYKKIGRAHV